MRPRYLVKPYEARHATNSWKNTMGPTSITEFQNFKRYSGLLNSTVAYWLKETISGMNFKLTFSDM